MPKQTCPTCGNSLFHCGLAGQPYWCGACNWRGYAELAVSESLGGDMSEFIKELPGPGSKCLVKHRGKFYVVSSVTVPHTGPETLVFPATAKGKITSFLEVAGYRGASREEAIAHLESVK